MKKRGFTLIELLAVITILGILAVMIVPKVTDILEKAEDDAYQRQINSIIDIAKKWGASNNDKLPDELDVLCTVKEEITNGNKAEGNYNYGDEYSCELGDNDSKTFYVLEESGDNVSLIMNMNIDSNGKGTIEGNTTECCGNAYDYLKNSVSNWTKLNQSQINIPTKDQIYKAAGNKTSGLPTWLYENLYINHEDPYGYWTSTLMREYDDDHIPDDYYDVIHNGSISGNMGNSLMDGVRPVITISKNLINNSLEDGVVLYLSLNTLVDEGYIQENKIINPKTDEKLEGCIKINYNKKYSQYVYEYIEDANVCK